MPLCFSFSTARCVHAMHNEQDTTSRRGRGMWMERPHRYPAAIRKVDMTPLCTSLVRKMFGLLIKHDSHRSPMS